MLKKRSGSWLVTLAFAFLVAACGALDPSASGVVSRSISESASRSGTLEVDPSATVPAKSPNVSSVGGENPRRFESPPGYLFDAIPPLYDPEFADVAEAPLSDDELVMGVEIDGAAKAYPITVLRSREMVNDEMAGIPILVSW